MMRALFAFGGLILAACAPADPPAEPVLLSVFAPAADAPGPQSGLFHAYGLVGRAVGFTHGDLTALPVHEIATDFPAGAPVGRFEGPRLSAVLAAVGADGAGARLTAIDGYQVSLEAELIAAHEPILALRAEGAALRLGGYGPAMLVWPRGTDPALAEMTDDLWPWGVFAVEAAPAVD